MWIRFVIHNSLVVQIELNSCHEYVLFTCLCTKKLLLFYRREVEHRDRICERVATFSQLGQTLDCIKKADTIDGLRTQVDIGSNFYVQAHMWVKYIIFILVFIIF